MNTLGPNVAGLWYPDTPARLARDAERLIGAGAEEAGSSGQTAAVVVPHAGWSYSGATAGRGFACLRHLRPERIVLLGPSHYEAFPGIALPAASEYRTPLGRVALDRETVERLGSRPGVRVDDRPFRQEHCLEAELPFLQHLFETGCRYDLVLVGAANSAESLKQAGDALAELDGPRTLWVVSTDFTHFGPRFGYVPFHDRVAERIRELDMGAVTHLLALDRAGFVDYVERTGATICGRHAVDLLLRVLGRQGLSGELIAYETSGALTGDWEHSVSYASLLFARTE